MNKNNKYSYWSPIPNNPRDNELYVDKKERNRENKFNKTNMLFGSAEHDKEDTRSAIPEAYGSRRTAAGVRVPRDEPSEPQKTQHLKVDKRKFAQDLEFWKRRNNQAAARERLKRKGAVPTKSGKRLFEDFYREATKRRCDNS